MFVGDSIQRTQWESMVCLLQPAVPDGKRFIHKDPPRKVFVAEVQASPCRSLPWLLVLHVYAGGQEFNASIEFYWAPFLVESNSDHATKHTVQRRQVKLDSITEHSQHWAAVDVLVFESYVWWMYQPLINATSVASRLPRWSVQTRSASSDFSSSLAEMAPMTSASTMSPPHMNWCWGPGQNGSTPLWIPTHRRPTSWAYHQPIFGKPAQPFSVLVAGTADGSSCRSWEWRNGSNGNCFNESYPIQRPFWGAGSSLDVMRAVAEALQGLKVKVTMLNITQLSEFRKDAHTSVYTERRGKLITGELRLNPEMYADCIHWCLPGVPDTWNEILYTYLIHGGH